MYINTHLAQFYTEKKLKKKLHKLQICETIVTFIYTLSWASILIVENWLVRF